MRKFDNASFAHCHGHTEYSAFDGLAPIGKLVMRAREMGFPALAITDHGTMGGCVKFVNECGKMKDKKGNDIPYPPIKPLIGSELYMSADHTAQSKIEQPRGRKGNHHLVLIAKNFKGYQNLSTLSNLAWTQGFYMDPRIDMEQLAKHSEGLICSTACLAGVVNTNLMYDRYDEAKKLCTIFKDIFGEDFFLEVMYHGIRLEMDIIPDIFKLSRELDIPVICTNDFHYIHKNQSHSHEVFLCMSTNKCLKSENRLKFPYQEFYLKSAQEMAMMFGEVPQCLTNTLAIVERVDHDDIARHMFGGMRLPKFDIPEGETPVSYVERLAWQGAKRLGWHKSEAHVKALKRELGDIRVAWTSNGYDFATYFLIVQDIVNFANENDILAGPGRGSGYGSLLLRCLGVTYGPDPLEYGLLWERFLGFDSKRFLLEDDFGFAKKAAEGKASVQVAEVDRAVEDDMGGVDRY